MSEPTLTPPESSWPKNVRRLLLLGLSTYLAIVVMLAVLQRAMIYLPARQSRIDPQEAGLAAGRVHSIALQTDDGLELHGWHVLPDGHAAADREACDAQLALGRPVVLYFSGNAGHRAWRIEDFEVFAHLDCDVFVFDYRGYGDNPGSPSEARLAADATAAWRYATQLRRIPPRRLILFGESLGGGVAVRLAAEQCAAGTPPGGLVLRATFSSLADAAAYHYPWLPVRWLLVDRYESARRMPQVSCPLLHLHGLRDSIIPVGLGRKLFAAAPPQSAHGIPKRFVELPAADHNDILAVAGAEVEAAVAQFLKHLEEHRNTEKPG
ncbi:MAG: alpha/beta hydrolase [Candidatus Anammoximicrobium sp.]|nr:alpha/beta hydrolase [Candidatus Anammoximicrobium sp.]